MVKKSNYKHNSYLESHEDHLAHKRANLLRLSHKERIDARLAARKQLAQKHFQPFYSWTKNRKQTEVKIQQEIP
ncbi:MAG: hypothetical protein ACI8ZB_002853 [Desulforhopalus sp.]|jgi:hypothetical protein